MLSREQGQLRQGPTGGRRWLAILGIIVVVVLLTLRQIATFWTDYLWFASVDQSRVFSTLVLSRVLLVVVATLVAFTLLWLNLYLAERLSPRRAVPGTGGPDEELVQRFQEWVEPRIGRVRLAVSAAFGLLIGLAAGAWWEDFLLFVNSTSFGIADPQFGRDVGFYVFRLPFYRDLFGWAFQFFLVTTLIVAAVHYLNGGIQVQNPVQRVAPGVKVHLSVLMAILALLKAAGYQLDKFDLLYSLQGQVFGASFTDVNARLPALNLLILISLFAAVLLLVNIRFRGWTLPAVALGLWLATSIVVGGIIPAVVQRFRVEPDELNKELPFVARNIEFTRAAYGLSDVQVREFEADENLGASAIQANRPTIDNLRLWDPTVLETTYRQLQELRTYYKFEDVDVDRYPIDGLTQVMLAARELDQDNIPGRGWVNTRLVYTHGFGAVVSPANDVTSEGQPDFYVADIPPENLQGNEVLDITEPRIYFGEGFDSGSFVFVRTKEPEVDFPLETGQDAVQFTTYAGGGGVQVGDLLRRAAFALRFADFNTLISGQLTSESRILMVRNVKDRVRKVAPFLYPDADPYLVTVDGRLLWVLDMYTVTSRYPYSQPAITARLDLRSTLPSSFNYIRNPVKAVVDAFEGTMTFYVVDDGDPVLAAYREIFPTIFTDGDEMPTAIREHLRYPEDLFRVQSDMYTRYHVLDARVFFNDADPWAIARDPSDTQSGTLRRQSFYQDDEGEYRPMVPYYLLMRLPDDDELSFLIMQPFTPDKRRNMVSFLVAKSGPDAYGEMIDFQLPRDRFIDGPGQVGARINQTPEISSEFTLLGQEGSQVIQGNMLVVPIDEAVLYVQPIYISARRSDSENASPLAPGTDASDATALPEFKRVVVAYQDTVVMRDSVDEALTAIFGEGTATPDPVDPGEGPGGEVPDEVATLVDRALAAFAEADQALADGDLGTYADRVKEAQRLLEQAQDLIDRQAADEPPATEDPGEA